MPTCPACGEPLADHGIGHYEFWGSRERHYDWQCENPDCPDAPRAPSDEPEDSEDDLNPETPSDPPK